MNRRMAAIVAVTTVVFRYAPGPPARAQVPPPKARPDATAGPVRAEMRNVNFRFTPDIAVLILRLDGDLQPRPGSDAVVFDRKDSFDIVIRSAELVMSDAQVNALMNAYVFAGEDAALSNVSISTARDKVTLTARRKGIPVEIGGTVDVSPDGRLRIRTTSVKAAKVPAKKLLDLFGVEVNDLMKDRPGRGVELVENDVLLDPAGMLPPPGVRGKLASVRAEPGRLRLRFGDAPPAAGRAAARGNLLAFHGNRVRFGRITMDDTDLELSDATPGDPLDFCLDEYKRQIAAGRATVSADLGLRVTVPDFPTLGRTSTPRPRR